MGKRISGWVALFQSLREAFIGVMEAEGRSLRLDFELSKRQLARAGGLAALAVFVCFWAIGVLVLLLVLVASLWLPIWAASLVVLALLVLMGLALVAGARGSLRRIEAPKAMIRRHVQEHVDWWEDEILPALGDTEDVPLPVDGSSPESDTEIR